MEGIGGTDVVSNGDTGTEAELVAVAGSGPRAAEIKELAIALIVREEASDDEVGQTEVRMSSAEGDGGALDGLRGGAVGDEEGRLARRQRGGEDVGDPRRQDEGVADGGAGGRGRHRDYVGHSVRGRLGKRGQHRGVSVDDACEG